MSKVLIIGNGGREHALAWACAKSPKVTDVIVAPGNAGTAQESMCRNLPVSATDIQALIDFAQQESIDLTLVGPEAPLAMGIVDRLKEAGIVCLGPTQVAAQLESSKVFCKQFLMDHHIPTARYAKFNDKKAALAYLKTQSYPLVIKADGLAAGKGVFISHTQEDARQAIEQIMEERAFGKAGDHIIIEAFLTGEEASFMVLCDGKTCLPLASSQDHKALENGDKGLNTGGMGAYSPAPVVDEALTKTVMTTIIEPTIKAMATHHEPFVGFLYAGLMIDNEGKPHVLEFNVRLGDPETQALLMRCRSDFYSLCYAAATSKLSGLSVQWDERYALGVVMANQGYPRNYPQGQIIQGLSDDAKSVKVFHSGTKQVDETIQTAGGRVLTVVALGTTVEEAQKRAYERVKTIDWPAKYYRTDIGYRAIAMKHALSSVK